MEYALTPHGASLSQVMKALAIWGQAHLGFAPGRAEDRDGAKLDEKRSAAA